jgi:serine/threonine protein kinase
MLNDPSLITPLLVSEKDSSPFIVQDYFDGIPLDKLAQANKAVSLNAFFTIACNLACALEKIQEAGIIHGGIKPHNILVNPGTLEIRLIDFISVLDVREVSHFIYNPEFIRGTLAYASPEQTGRMNHRVVFSSDLYSLGIVFYEMLTGNLPFYSEDPLELIHSHLEENTTSVYELNHDIPVVLSNIIAKLMLRSLRNATRARADCFRTSAGAGMNITPAGLYMNSLWKAACQPTELYSYPKWSAVTAKPE